MKFRFVLAAVLMLASSLTWAQPKLDLPALQNYFETGKRVDVVAKKYPTLNDGASEFLLASDNKAFLSRMKSLHALDEVTVEVKKGGYKSVEDYLNTTKRIMSALFAVQLEQSPEYSSPDSMRKMVADQKKQLQANGIAPDRIAQMMASVEGQLKQLDKLVEFAKKAQPDDIVVVRKNLDYVTKMIDKSAK